MRIKSKNRPNLSKKPPKRKDAEQVFLKCKVKCICKQAKCMAIGLKQCPLCQNILKSTCSKGRCQADRKKPIIIVSAAATASSSKWKAPTHVADSGSDIYESTDLEESDSDSCEMENESKSESSNIDEDLDLIKVLRATWKLFIPPVAVESVLIKW